MAVLGGSVGKKPILNWYKLNTDGSFIGNLGKAREGGIIKNHHGTGWEVLIWLIGTTFGVVAKLWALKDGLTLCNQLHIQFLIVELDASVLVTLLNNVNNFPRSLSPFIDGSRVLLDKIPERLIDVMILWQKAELICLVILFLFICPLIVF